MRTGPPEAAAGSGFGGGGGQGQKCESGEIIAKLTCAGWPKTTPPWLKKLEALELLYVECGSE